MPETPADGLRVVLICPQFHSYQAVLEKACAALGHSALMLDERIGNSFLAKFATRAGLVRRIPALARGHIERLIARVGAERPDVVLLINVETVDADAVAGMRAASPGTRIVLYMWDSSRNKPLPDALIRAVDHAYSFDPTDCARREGLHHLPLFHSHDAPPAPDTADPEYDYSFIGTAHPRRIKVLADLARRFRRDGTPYFFYLFSQSGPHHLYHRLLAARHGYRDALSRQRIAFDEYIRVTRTSRAAIDVEHQDQQGLTIRTFESIFAGTPLITTNASLALYDFAGDVAAEVFDPSDDTAPLPLPARRPATDYAAHFDRFHVTRWLRTMIAGETPDLLRKEAPPPP